MSAGWLAWSSAKPDAGWQGIHYLELELLPHPTTPTHARLTVHLYQNTTAPLDGRSFALAGGRRTRDLPFSVSHAQGSNTAKIDITAIGDHSTYSVTLLDGGGLPVHPFFATADFVFTLDCERGDCRPSTQEAERGPRKRPAVDLLTKDYEGFVHLLADRVRVSNPHWADLSSASMERVLLELLSHHGDMLSYFQDRVANEAFLDDASQRYTLRQHGLLLGYPLFDGSAAETLLAFQVAKSGFLPAGLEVRMAGGGDEAKVVFHVKRFSRVLAHHNRLEPAAWPGATDATVPAGATRLLLWGYVDDLAPGHRVAFVQGSFTQIVTLTEVRYELMPGWTADPSDPPPAAPADHPSRVTVIAWATPLEQAVRPWAKDAPFSLLGNLAEARFGEGRTAVIARNPTSALPRAIPIALEELLADRQNAIVLTERRDGGSGEVEEVFVLRALRVPEGPVVFAVREGGGVEPLIEVTIDKDPWYRVEHLHGSQSYDRHYVATADEDGSLWLQFGDGRRGASVEFMRTGSSPEIVLRYWIGDPIAGNCAAHTLRQVVTPADPAVLQGLGALSVTNVIPGNGGRQPEPKAAARLRIPASLRRGKLQRAVSIEDYAKAALDVPGVERAVARTLDGPFNTVLVLVDPEGQVELGPDLRQAVMARIEEVRMAGREHIVDGPQYVPLEVKLAICAEPGSLPHRVREAVYGALRPGTRERPGFFHPDRLDFGESVELGDLLAAVQEVAGVRAVKALRFRKLRVASSGPVEPRILLRPTEVARLDADDDYPEQGRLAVLVVGLDPGLTEKNGELLEVT